MSGGSYNYFYAMDPDEKLGRIVTYGSNFAYSLREAGVVEDDYWGDYYQKTYGDKPSREEREAACEAAAKEIEEIVAVIEPFKKRLEALREVFHAVEWKDSGDSGANDVWVDAIKWLRAKEAAAKEAAAKGTPP